MPDPVTTPEIAVDPRVAEQASNSTPMDNLVTLRDYLLYRDSGSGDAKILTWAIDHIRSLEYQKPQTRCKSLLICAMPICAKLI